MAQERSASRRSVRPTEGQWLVPVDDDRSLRCFRPA